MNPCPSFQHQPRSPVLLLIFLARARKWVRPLPGGGLLLSESFGPSIYPIELEIYTSLMTQRRTTIQVDDELLAEAQAALGTYGLKDTVDAALSQAVRTARRIALIDRLRTQRGVDLDPESLQQTRRWRTS